MRRLRYGFTLIEMLVVLAIVALLAAVLFPVFSHVREKGRQAACASNLHQLGLALSAYTIDYDEQFPTSKIAAVNTTNIAWAGQVYPHVQNTGVFRCPTDDTASANLPVVSYGLNLNLAAASSLAALAAPARTVLLFEVSGDTAQITDYAEGQANGSNPPQTSSAGNGLNGALLNLTGSGSVRIDGAVYATGLMDNRGDGSLLPFNQYPEQDGRHSGGSNFLAADGHVAWQRGSEVSAGLSALASTDAQATTGCGFGRLGSRGGAPCAEGTGNGKHALTFSTQ